DCLELGEDFGNAHFLKSLIKFSTYVFGLLMIYTTICIKIKITTTTKTDNNKFK
ncbi:5787_t:CDS:1, partial [Entrophospora sp. SA101]